MHLLIIIIPFNLPVLEICQANIHFMKTATVNNTRKLDIRFVPIDSMNPYAIMEPFSEENIEKIKNELHAKLGHLSNEISKSDGHIKVYTQGNTLVGKPQFVNFSKEVWEKIYTIPEQKHKLQPQKGNIDDYLDHENYLDL